MEWERIRKGPVDCMGANLADYEMAVRSFSWPQARAMLEGLPDGASISRMKPSIGICGQAAATG